MSTTFLEIRKHSFCTDVMQAYTLVLNLCHMSRKGFMRLRPDSFTRCVLVSYMAWMLVRTYVHINMLLADVCGYLCIYTYMHV